MRIFFRILLRILFPVGILVAVFLLPAPLSFWPPRETSLDIIQKYAEHYGLDLPLVLAVIEVESEGKLRAVSKKGARGLMQVMPVHARNNNLSPEELFDIETNLKLGCAYLRETISQLGQGGGLEAYNLGESKYRRGYRAKVYRKKIESIRRKYDKTW